MDHLANKSARNLIAAIKIAAPGASLRVIDRAIQLHGGAGVSQDLPLARMYAWQRTLRLADGPDEVHRNILARLELDKKPVDHQSTRSHSILDDVLCHAVYLARELGRPR